MNQTLYPFITELLEQKGYTNEQEERKEALRKNLAAKLDEFIMIRTLNEFSKEDLASFQTLLDEKKSKAELQNFIIDHIPDYSTFLAGVLVEFQEVYLSSS